MASVVLPVLAKDGVGAAYIPRSDRMHATSSDLLILAHKGERVAAARKALARLEVPILNVVESDDAVGFVVRPPATLSSRQMWQALGVSDNALGERDRSIDLEDGVALTRRYRDNLRAAGLLDRAPPRRIGQNLAGSVVYETLGGRVAVSIENVAHYEHDTLPDGGQKGAYRDRFLRAQTPADLAGCAEGVARAIATGEHYDRATLATLHRDIVADAEAPELSLFAFQEEVEAALTVQAARLAGQGVSLRDIARELTDRSAAHAERSAQRLRLQQYSTPLPIGAVAADILRIAPGEIVLEPSVGNGSLAIGAAVAGARIEAFEIDETRAARAGRVLRAAGAAAVNVRPRAFPRPGEDAPGIGVGVVLANPPFEAMKRSVETDRTGRKLAINRLDHRIVFDALENLNERGRSFLVLPGEMMGEGKLEGAQATFNRYLHATFEVAGAAVLDGRLYRKSGAEFPVVIYALGPRLEEPLTAEQARRISDELPFLRTTDELFAWGDAAAAQMQSIMERRGLWEAPAQALPAGPEIGSPRPKPQRRWFPRRIGDTGQSARGGPRPDAPAPAPPGVGASGGGGEQTPGVETPGPSAEGAANGAPQPGEGATAGSAGVAAGEQQQRPLEQPPVADAAPDVGPAEVAPAVDEAPDGPVYVSDTIPDGLDEEDAFAISPEVLIDDILIENDPFQVTYEPASKVGGPPLKIQKALASPVAEALADLERKRGPIDAFVAEQLGVAEAELGQLLHAGQVDGVGLTLHKGMLGQSVIIGDLMGVGKGRQLAALSRAALKEQRPVIFFSDNASLFTDFVGRDLSTVLRIEPTELRGVLRPYIVNSSKDAHVLDPGFTGVRRGEHGFLFKALPASAKKGKRIDPSANMILSSYSQMGALGREEKLAALMKFVDEQENPPLLITDESHKAAGETSHVGVSVAALVDAVVNKGGSVAYSSGTALKAARNLKVYGSALPDVGLPTDKLVELIEKEPLALQEALSFEMARAGSLIARELDNTNVRREMVSLQDIDPNRYAMVLEKVDLFANKMAELLALGREVKHWSQDRKRELENQIKADIRDEEARTRALAQVNVHYQSPASRFHHLSNYLTLAINGVFLEDLVLRSIGEGRKPVIAVANTGDALLRDLIANTLQEGGDDLEEGVTVVAVGGEVRMPEKPHLGHVIKRMADRLLTIRETDAFGAVTETRLEEYEDWLARFNQDVDRADFAPLSLSVIDDLSASLADHGLSLGEITGRGFTIARAPDGDGWIARGRQKPLKQDVVSAFNNGRTDVLLLNQSAAVGLSVQSSPAVGYDIRPREMIKAQLQADVTQERQMDGRINRVGQLFAPLYTIPQQGLASSDRLSQLFNKKNRSLTATSTATRENESNIAEALDLLNEVGQFVSFDYLRNNPDIADLLDIDVDVDVEPTRIRSGFSEKLMGRMIALPTAMQRAIMGELDTAFQMRIGLLDALGENPLRLREYDWKAAVEPVRQLIAGDAAAERMSERPLTLTKIMFSESVKPLNGSLLEEAISRGRSRMIDRDTSREMSVNERLDEIAPGNMGMDVSFADPIFDRLMNRADDLRSVGATERSVTEAADIWNRRSAIESSGELKGFEKMVIEAGRKTYFLREIAPYLEPGAIISVNPAAIGRLRDSTLFQAAVEYIEGTSKADQKIALPAVVTDVRFNEDKALNLGEWDVRIAVPGEERVIDVPLGSAFALLEEARKNGEEGWLFGAARATDNALGLMSEIAPLWSELLDSAMSDARGAHFSDGGDIGPTDTPRMGDGTLEAARMSALFDHTSGGKVKRTRYAVEGNLFAAVAALAGKRMGEKAMYTDDNGAIRHCYLLKKDEHKKVLEQLGKSVAGRVAFMRANAEDIVSMVGGFGSLVRSIGAEPESMFGDRREGLFPPLFEDIKRRIEALGDKVNDEALRAALWSRLGEMHIEMVKAVREQGGVNTGMFVGADVFGDSNEKHFRTSVAIRVREGKNEASSTFSTYVEPAMFSTLTSAMSDAGAFVFFDNHLRCGQVVKAKNVVCDKPKGGVAANWTNRGIERTTLRHSTVGKWGGSLEEGAAFLAAAASDPKNEGVVGFKGALVAYNDMAQVVSRQLAPLVRMDRELRSDAAVDASAQHEPVSQGAQVSSVGL